MNDFEVFSLNFDERAADGTKIWTEYKMTEEMTIEQMDDEQGYADYVAQMTYETRKYNVHCEVCPARDYGSQEQLINRGWLLDRASGANATEEAKNI